MRTTATLALVDVPLLLGAVLHSIRVEAQSVEHVLRVRLHRVRAGEVEPHGLEVVDVVLEEVAQRRPVVGEEAVRRSAGSIQLRA